MTNENPQDNSVETLKHVAASAAILAIAMQEGVQNDANTIITKSSDSDLVTNADKASEALIRGMLKDTFPQHGFLGEEGTNDPSQSGYSWVVDPIDSTNSFVHGLPGASVAIALVKTDTIDNQHGPETAAAIIATIHPSVLGAEDRTVEMIYAGTNPPALGTSFRVPPVRLDNPLEPERQEIDKIKKKGLDIVHNIPETEVHIDPQKGLSKGAVTVEYAPKRKEETATLLQAIKEAGAQERNFRASAYSAFQLLKNATQANITMEGRISAWDVAPAAHLVRTAGGEVEINRNSRGKYSLLLANSADVMHQIKSIKGMAESVETGKGTISNGRSKLDAALVDRDSLQI